MKPKSRQTQPEGGLAPGLYLVATPIGNLADITLRALETLRGVDLILCEDTRVTAKLLRHFGIKARLLSHHDHNEDSRRLDILNRLAAGGRVALVSDAGTPLICDPGYKLAREAARAGVKIIPVPGPSSVITGLVLSGLPAERFYFAGFLPAKAKAREEAVRELARIPATLVIFETANRLQESLVALSEAMGKRDAAVTRELTKLFEEARHGTLADLAAHYQAAGPPKGEIVLVVGPPQEHLAEASAVEALLARLLKTESLKDAAAIAAAQTGLPRKETYAMALRLKEKP